MNKTPNTGRAVKGSGEVVNWATLLTSIKQMTQASLGGSNGIKVDDVDMHRPPNGKVIFAIKAITESVVNNVDGDIDISGETIPISDIIYGKWTGVQLTSGTVILYYRKI